MDCQEDHLDNVDQNKLNVYGIFNGSELETGLNTGVQKILKNGNRKILKFEIIKINPPKSVVKNCSHLVKIMNIMWEQFKIFKNEILYPTCKENAAKQTIHQIVAPSSVKDKIPNYLHNDILAGHFGRGKTLKNVKRRLYWPRMTEDVKLWCEACDQCARRKPGPVVG